MGVTEPEIVLKPIGIVRSVHTREEETPIQPVFACGCKGHVEVFPEFEEGLSDLEGFSHIFLIYSFHRCGGVRLRVKPFLQDVVRGVFSTRAPCRPNLIGLSVVKLLRREGRVLHVENIDILDGTPLLDIKPYSARFDRIEDTQDGWYREVDGETAMIRGKRGFGGAPGGRQA